MGEFRGIGGVARKIVAEYKGINNVARKVVGKYRSINGVARKISASEMYLIQDGEYKVPFQNTSVWSYYPITGSTNFRVRDEEEYIEIYNEGYNMGAIITTDPIDLSRFSRIHVEADIIYYVQTESLENRAAIGAYDSVPDALGAGTSGKWAAGEGTIFYKNIHIGTGNGTTAVPVSQSYDISSSEMGHIFAYITSFNYGSDYSYLRIKNLWLD